MLSSPQISTNMVWLPNLWHMFFDNMRIIHISFKWRKCHARKDSKNTIDSLPCVRLTGSPLQTHPPLNPSLSLSLSLSDIRKSRKRIISDSFPPRNQNLYHTSSQAFCCWKQRTSKKNPKRFYTCSSLYSSLLLQIGCSGWLTGDYNFRCQPVDYSNDPKTLRVRAQAQWLTFIYLHITYV